MKLLLELDKRQANILNKGLFEYNKILLKAYAEEKNAAAKALINEERDEMHKLVNILDKVTEND